MRQPVPALAMPQTCMSPAVLQDALNTHPALESARYAMEGTREQAQHTRYGGVIGGVQLSQSLSKDFGGSPGHATAVAVDVSIPLQWRSQKDAMAAKLQGQYDEAAEQYALAIAEKPANIEYRLRLQRALVNASVMLVQRGDKLAEQKDYNTAYVEYRKAYAFDSANELALIKARRAALSIRLVTGVRRTAAWP